MYEKDVIVTTKYGQMPSFVACPDAPGQYPGIIFYMDAPGIREELRNMTRRIAKQGYFAVLPDMYYRLGTLRFDVNRRDDEMFQCMRAAMNSLTNAKVMDDTAGLLGFIDSQDQAKPGPVGCRKLLTRPGLLPQLSLVRAATNAAWFSLNSSTSSLPSAASTSLDTMRCRRSAASGPCTRT